MTAKDVHEAIAAVMTDVTAVAKDSQNAQQGYAFRGSETVLAAVAPAMRRHRLYVAPDVEDIRHEIAEIGGRGTRMTRCTVKVRYRFHGPNNTHVDARVAAEAMDSGDKATAKAMTVALRTVLLQVFALPTQDSDAVTDAMIRKLMTLFTHADIRTRDHRLHYAAQMIGREVESTKDMTAVEWQQVVDALEQAIAEPKHEQGARPTQATITAA